MGIAGYLQQYLFTPVFDHAKLRQKRYLFKMDLIKQGFNKDLFLSSTYKYPLKVCFS